MSSSEEQQALIQRDLILNLQNQRMVEQAFGERNYAPKAPLTTVDEETIKEYNNQFKMVQFETYTAEDGSIHTVEGEDGKPIPMTKKFVTIPPPELESVNEAELAPVRGEDTERFAKGELREMVLKDYQDIDIELSKVRNIIEELNDQKKKFTTALNALPQTNFVATLSRQNNKIRQLKIDTEKARIENALEEIEDKIDDLNNYITFLTGEITNIQNFEARQAQAISHNQAVRAGVEERNKEKIRAYQEALNVMNKGAFKEEKRYDESEEEFLQRLQQNAENSTIDETKFQALEFIRKKFKEHLKELIRSDVIIEEVANELKMDGDQEEQRAKLDVNKKFALFKSAFITIFGKNNASLKAGDIVEFIHEFVKGDVSSIASVIQGEKAKGSTEEVSPPKNSYITITNPRNNKKAYFLIVTNDIEQLVLLWSSQLLRHTFQEVEGEYTLERIKEQTGLTFGQVRKELNWRPQEDLSMVAYNLLQKHPNMRPIDFHSDVPPTESYDVEFGEHILGWGIKPEAIPKSVHFGVINIMLHKLYYNNVLSVRRRDGTNITGFPNSPVSDDFVKLIMKMIKGETPKYSEINSLKTVEMDLFNRLMTVAKLHKSHSIDSSSSIEHLKHRLTLIEGEIGAGNDSHALKMELYRVVHALKNFGAISARDAREFLAQF